MKPARNPPSALPIIKRYLHWSERQRAIATVKKLMQRLPQSLKNYNSYQWVVWMYIATLIIFFGTFILIFN